MLLDREKAKDLISSKVDQIVISVEGYRKEIHEKYRVGSDHYKVINNIENFLSLRKIMPNKTEVVIQTIKFLDNQMDSN